MVNTLDDATNLVNSTGQFASQATVKANGNIYSPILFPGNRLYFVRDLQVLFINQTETESVILVEGEDYEVLPNFNIRILSYDKAPDETFNVNATGKTLNPTTVNAAQINGAVDSSTEARSGIKAFDLSFNQFGFNPRIFIAPNYSQLAAVASELITYGEKYRGFALIDSVAGWTRAEALADRGPSGTIFNTSSYAAGLLYPRLKAYDAATDTDIVVPYSAYFAGVWTRTINNEGYWVSPSNKEIRGITGVERNITSSYTDPQTDVQLLNEAGIISFINAFGSGRRTYGNRSAAWPSNSDPSQFLSVRMTAGVLYDSLEQAMVQFIDRPINNALIDAITETVNGFIRTLIGREALVDGECTYDPAKNPPTQVANGQLVFDLTFMPPVPGERITFEAFIDINLLSNLGAE